jgi:hypothetical protein
LLEEETGKRLTEADQSSPLKETHSLVEGEVTTKATTFLFVVLNGTWALMAYMLHVRGVRTAVIATVVAIGVPLGNLALYAGVRLAKKLLRKSG